MSTPLRIALYQPEIPPNTGNVIRLCANMGAELSLIHPLGFNLENKQLRRAGLDYHDLANVREFDDYSAFLGSGHSRLFACSTRGAVDYHEIDYQVGDSLLFGPETRGLPDDVLEAVPAGQRIKIPMKSGNRSLNLSNAVAVIAYEAWRQLGFQ